MLLGIDIGSISINAVLVDHEGRVAAWEIDRSGYDHKESIGQVARKVCAKAGIETAQVKRIVGTGYGRRNIEAAQETYTEITCHAVGVRALFDDVETVVDIGGQDSKVIRLTPSGRVEKFHHERQMRRWHRTLFRGHGRDDENGSDLLRTLRSAFQTTLSDQQHLHRLCRVGGSIGHRPGGSPKKTWLRGFTRPLSGASGGWLARPARQDGWCSPAAWLKTRASRSGCVLGLRICASRRSRRSRARWERALLGWRHG